MGSSASASSARRGTGNAPAASTSASATRASSATSAASRWRPAACAASAWATSSWPARQPHLVRQGRAEPPGPAAQHQPAPSGARALLRAVHRHQRQRGRPHPRHPAPRARAPDAHARIDGEIQAQIDEPEARRDDALGELDRQEETRTGVTRRAAATRDRQVIAEAQQLQTCMEKIAGQEGRRGPVPLLVAAEPLVPRRASWCRVSTSTCAQRPRSSSRLSEIEDTINREQEADIRMHDRGASATSYAARPSRPIESSASGEVEARRTPAHGQMERSLDELKSLRGAASC